MSYRKIAFLLEIETYTELEDSCVDFIFIVLTDLLSCISVEHSDVVSKLHIELLGERNPCTKTELDVEAAILCILVIVCLYRSVAGSSLEV